MESENEMHKTNPGQMMKCKSGLKGVCVYVFLSSLFSIPNVVGVFSPHESFMENKVHSAKSTYSQQFCADTLRDTSKNPRQ